MSAQEKKLSMEIETADVMTKDDEAEVVPTEASRVLVRPLVVCSKDMGL